MELNFARQAKEKTVWLRLSGDGLSGSGGEMEAVAANTQDAAREKHVPELTYEKDGLHVQIGSVEHPMLAEHHIEWILVQTMDGLLIKSLSPGDAPKAVFPVRKEEVVAVYEHCNLHGLWKKDA